MPMPDNTEAFDIIQAAQDAVGVEQLDTGLYWSHSTSTVIDIRQKIHDEAQRVPDIKAGSYTVANTVSFAGYLAKHGTDHTEIWGSRDGGRVVATIDAHTADAAGHERHSAVLQLHHSDDWTEWTARNGTLMNQLDFAEFVEDHLPNFGEPTGAEALELARSFRATQKVEFGTTRHASGATTLSYVENTDAKAATKKGEIAFPDRVHLGMRVYDQGRPYELDARLRWRLRNGELLMGYKLERPKDVLQAAFDGVIDEIETLTDRTVWQTV